jgi:predicted O-linked N-acetylglucosamine transferase (SPINDLY family)
MSDEALAQLVKGHEIDILIDLSGHTAYNRLPMFAYRPAPVQVSWLGYFATTGLAEMDYFIADPWTAPAEEDALFVEQIWRLPETYLCFSKPAVTIDVGPLPALTEGQITFGCFNGLRKLNEHVIDLWVRILDAVPDSQLFLKCAQLKDISTQTTVVKQFADRGVAAQRLILEGPSPRDELLASYNRVDIALDPFPYPGGTTSVESLWMGVPVVTMKGDRFLSRVGETIAQNIGMPEWIATSPDDYVEKAVGLSRDLNRLSAARAGLRQKIEASPLFDAPRFARHFSEAMWAMWQRRIEAESPNK